MAARAVDPFESSAQTRTYPAELRSVWKDEAACASPLVDPAVFFPADRKHGRPYTVEAAIQMEQAKEVCRGCNVQVECLEFALTIGAEGIWGGTDTEERKRILRLRGQGRHRG